MNEAAPAPWRKALRRFKRNPPAMTALLALMLIAAFCLFGPLISPHAYDRVYPDYVKAPASLAAHPSEEEARSGLETIAAHMHAHIADGTLQGDMARVTLQGDRPIDERLLAYFERSGLFGKPDIVERRDDGRTIMVDAPIHHVTFLAGADSNGRDLSLIHI